MDVAASSVGNESVVSLAWLEEALGHAYAHGQTQTLAYLEWVMEDEVFVMEMAATRKPFTVGVREALGRGARVDRRVGA